MRGLDCTYSKDILPAGYGVDKERTAASVVSRCCYNYDALIDKARPDGCPGAVAETTRRTNAGTNNVRAVIVDSQKRLNEKLPLADVCVSESRVSPSGKAWCVLGLCHLCFEASDGPGPDTRGNLIWSAALVISIQNALSTLLR